MDLRACGIISMGHICCDHCSREIKYGEKYAYVSDWSKDTDRSDKASRYCAECSVALGYMHWVRDTKTGRVFARLKGGEIVNGYENVKQQARQSSN
ncbi:unnamed protein product [marine sediment metagenome]|uniref:Uncharacterized protein n=1 Tax=marine sediment metagenome TaxID=412755 RepID=X1Q3R0_9ZZZZ